MKLTQPQLFLIDKFISNTNFDCCVHKHWRSRAWFQVQCRSWFEVSDQTLKSLEVKGYLKKIDDNTWVYTGKVV